MIDEVTNTAEREEMWVAMAGLGAQAAVRPADGESDGARTGTEQDPEAASPPCYLSEFSEPQPNSGARKRIDGTCRDVIEQSK